MTPRSRLLIGSAHALDLPAESVHMIATSPPYWALRKYAGEQEGELGRRYVGNDIADEYHDLARERLTTQVGMAL